MAVVSDHSCDIHLCDTFDSVCGAFAFGAEGKRDAGGAGSDDLNRREEEWQFE